MALLNCEECDGQLSTNAELCPHCGSETTVSFIGTREMDPMILLASVLGVFSIIFVSGLSLPI